MKRILQLDGGGAKGLIQVQILKELEKKVGKPIYEIFDLIVGTSVGSIIGGPLSTGKITATEFADVMYNSIDDIFKKNFFRDVMIFSRVPKYKRENVQKVLNKYIGKNTKMNDCSTRFMCTAVNVNSGKNHYYKSWEDKDGNENLISVIDKSYAAPLYFGVYNDGENTWVDGGTGNSNCSIDECIIESFLQEWSNEDIYIMSLGTGYKEEKHSYKETKRWGNMKTLGFFMDPADGGLARKQSIKTKLKMADALSNAFTNLNVYRIDTIIGNKIDKLDGAKYKDTYVAIGKRLAKYLDLSKVGL